MTGQWPYRCPVHPQNGFNEPHPSWECGIPMLPELCPHCGQPVVQVFPVETVTLNITAILAGTHTLRKLEVGATTIYCATTQRLFQAPICRERFAEHDLIAEIEE